MILLSEAIEEFLEAGKADGVSLATTKWYRSILASFAKHHSDGRIDDFNAKIIRSYIVSLRERDGRYLEGIQKPRQSGGLSAASINGYIRALHAFWSWCADEYEVKNPMKNISKPKKMQPTVKAISSEDYIKIFNATSEGMIGMRDRAILAFLADTGCRVGGLLNLKIDDLQLGEKRALVVEKGNKQRMIYFTNFTRRLLLKWLWIRESKTEYVFVSFNTRDQLTDSGLNQIMKRLKKKAGVTGRVNPHAFRHRFAREYLQNGGDISTLAKILGHNDVNTTATYYAIFSDDELGDLHEKYSPMTTLGQIKR